MLNLSMMIVMMMKTEAACMSDKFIAGRSS